VASTLASAAPSATPFLEPPAYALKLPARLPAAVERFTDRCSRGEDTACLDAAAMFLEPRVAPVRPAVAAQLLEAACQRSHLSACAELGWLYAQGLGVPYDASRARSLMERACQAGDAHGCARLGGELVFALHFAQDLAQGMAALEKGCNGSDAHGCKALGRALEEVVGNRSAAQVAHEKAIALASKSCQAGRFNECKVLISRPIVESAALPFQHAMEMVCRAGGDCSRVKMANFNRLQLCNEGHYGSCVDLTDNHGGNAPRDFEWLKRACLGGLSRGCSSLDQRFSGPQKYDVLEQACREGELAACAAYARNDKSPRDSEERARYEFACVQHSARHCSLMLFEQRSTMDPAAFVRSMEATCPSVRYRVEGRDMDAEGCKIAADAYRTGDSVPRDAARALDLYRQACFTKSSPRYSGRSVAACVRAAEMFDRGEGVDPDPAMATALWAGACAAREDTACSAAAQRVERGIGILPSSEDAARLRAYWETER